MTECPFGVLGTAPTTFSVTAQLVEKVNMHCCHIMIHYSQVADVPKKLDVVLSFLYVLCNICVFAGVLLPW